MVQLAIGHAALLQHRQATGTVEDDLPRTLANKAVADPPVKL
jgi:hypothetical protein